MRQLDVRLLGRFEVVVDSHPVPAEAWPQRRAADLVKVLALARSHRMARDEVLETLWPQLGADAAAANLHKDPADEEAHRELAGQHLQRGDRLAAARQLRRLGDELARLGLEPSHE